LSDHDEFERRNNVKALSLRADAGNQIAWRVAAETSIAPILALPFRNQHLLEVELTPAGSSTIVPPAERKGAIGRGSTPALRERIS